MRIHKCILFASVYGYVFVPVSASVVGMSIIGSLPLLGLRVTNYASIFRQRGMLPHNTLAFFPYFPTMYDTVLLETFIPRVTLSGLCFLVSHTLR